MAQQITMSPSNFLNQPDAQQQTPQQIPPTARKVKTGNNLTMSVSDWSKVPAPQAQGGAQAQWSPNPDDSVAEIQTPDGNRHIIHADDLAEAQRRDPNIKVVSQPQVYRDYARGRMYDNWTRAISGQPMERPEDQAEAKRGRQAGTIAGGLQIATGAAGGLFTPGVQVAQEASSILGPEGQPIVKAVLKKTPSIAAKATSSVVDTAQAVAQWSRANLVKAAAIEAVAHEMGVDPFQLLSKVVKYGKHLFE